MNNNRILHMEESTDEIILRAENLSIPKIGEIVGKSLKSICENKKMLGTATTEEAKEVILFFILAELGYDLEDEDE